MRMSRISIIIAASALLAACATTGTTGSSPDPSSSPAASVGSSPQSQGGTVTVVTHDSFAVPPELVEAFQAETGVTLEFVAPGDGGTLVNQLILTKGAPLGDVVYGVDNTFASRATVEGVFAGELTAIDYSDVCINIDKAYFAQNNLAEPVTLDDLTKPEYRGLLSVPNPATSSPGLAFLLGTVAAKGEAWPDYWAALRANEVRVTASWSDSYFTDFSAPNYGGDYPLVVSYASSPPFEVAEDGTAPTAALLETCFRQVEYAGVLAGADNPEGAAQVIEWMLSEDFQAALPENMYVYPAVDGVAVPAAWEAHAPLAENPWSLTEEDIAASRDEWIKEWTAVVID